MTANNKWRKILLIIGRIISWILQSAMLFFRSGKREAILSLRASEVTVFTLALMRSPFMAWFALLQRTLRETCRSSQLSYWLSRISQPSTLPEQRKEREIVSIRWISKEVGCKRFGRWLNPATLPHVVC